MTATPPGERGENPAGSSTSRQGHIPADSFPLRLVIARFDAGRLSIEKAAERCGLNSENWRRWEDGAMPRDKAEVAQAIHDGLGVDREWLLYGGPLPSGRGGLTKRPGTNTNTVRYLPRPARPILPRATGRRRNRTTQARAA